MPDPSWSFQYNYAQTPEGNGFARELYGNPAITLVTGGSAANRRVTVDSGGGDAVFLTSQVPSLSQTTGATAEMVVAVSGAANGNAGVEMTFLGRAVMLQVHPSKVSVTIAADAEGEQHHEIPTASNAGDTTIRFVYWPDTTCSVYRNGVLLGTFPTYASARPFQRFLWWCEAGATATFRAMRLWVGGAMAPG
jgi:hypothetical protein